MGKSNKINAFGCASLLILATVVSGLPFGNEKTLATVPNVHERATVDSSGNQSNNYNGASDISKDGRYIAFDSLASNLVVNDTNSKRDIFVRDKVLGTTERVSVDSNGNQGNEGSNAPKISANGRYVVFSSSANNLVSNDTNSMQDVFIHDRTNGTTEIISVSTAGLQGNDSSYGGAEVTEDGRFVVFDSDATNLIGSDTNATTDVFLRDRVLNTTKRISVSSTGQETNGASTNGIISCGGRFIVFQSLANNLVASDTNGRYDIFIVDRLGDGYVESFTVSGNGGVGSAKINCSGDHVVFASTASNLVVGDNNNKQDNFVYNVKTKNIERISLASDGSEGNGASTEPSISSDGRYVVFSSDATNFTTSDTNGTSDIFLRSISTGTTERVTVNSSNVQGNGFSGSAIIADDGAHVTYISESTNLVSGDTNGIADVFISETGVTPVAVCSQ